MGFYGKDVRELSGNMDMFRIASIKCSLAAQEMH